MQRRLYLAAGLSRWRIRCWLLASRCWLDAGSRHRFTPQLQPSIPTTATVRALHQTPYLFVRTRAYTAGIIIALTTPHPQAARILSAVQCSMAYISFFILLAGTSNIDPKGTLEALALVNGPSGLNGSFNQQPIPIDSFVWL